MIRVIATITLKPGHLAPFLAAFKANMPAVLAEPGCIEYVPMVDCRTAIPVQRVDADAVTIVEAWASPAALEAHLQTPHMATYREVVKEWVADVSLKVLQVA